MRMADEADAAQERGELATKGDRKSPKLGDMGIDDRRLAEWQEIHDAGESFVFRQRSPRFVRYSLPPAVD
jgi:hypothetical protein